MAHPVRWRAEVYGCTAEGAYHRLVLEVPEAASRARPGHFASLARRPRGGPRGRPDRPGRRLRRHPGAAGRRRPRSGPLDLIAPLGTPFPVPDAPVKALLVGHGQHAAPLPALGEQLTARGGQLGYLLGAPTAAALHGVDSARALTQDVLVVTEDGSA
ncbi:hypothetical protein ACFQ1I_37510 [Kitasatospora arboriphila]